MCKLCVLFCSLRFRAFQSTSWLQDKLKEKNTYKDNINLFVILYKDYEFKIT